MADILNATADINNAIADNANATTDIPFAIAHKTIATGYIPDAMADMPFTIAHRARAIVTIDLLNVMADIEDESHFKRYNSEIWGVRPRRLRITQLNKEVRPLTIGLTPEWRQLNRIGVS
jgi:hypothetical protein